MFTRAHLYTLKGCTYQKKPDKNKEKIKDYLELNAALKDVIYKQKEDFSDDEVKESSGKTK